MAIAGHSPAPYLRNGACRSDVRQRITGYEDQVGTLPGVSRMFWDDSCQQSAPSPGSVRKSGRWQAVRRGGSRA